MLENCWMYLLMAFLCRRGQFNQSRRCMAILYVHFKLQQMVNETLMKGYLWLYVIMIKINQVKNNRSVICFEGTGICMIYGGFVYKNISI